MRINKISALFFAITISTIGMAMAREFNDDFSPADFDKIQKGEKNFIGAKLEEACLRGFSLSGVDFRGADLEGANFQNADLTNVDFRNADMDKVNLRGAKIDGANFTGAELEYATWIDGRTCAEGSIGACW